MSSKRYSYEKTGLVRAQSKHVRSSARKARLVLDTIRGKNVLEARALLLYSKRDVAKDIELVLRSAVHNAETNHGLDADSLVIEGAFADESLTMKRWQPRARGRAFRIRKRTSHITILLRPTGTSTGTSAAEREEEKLAARPKRVQNPSRKERAAARTSDADAPAEEAPVAEAVAPEAVEEAAPAAVEEAAPEAVEEAAPEASAEEEAAEAADEPKKDEG